MSIRPFEYAEVVLMDEPDIDPNDQDSILEHLDKVVRNLIEKSSKRAANTSELKLPLIRLKVDYFGFMTINPQRFGQKYVGKVANPQDILIFPKASKKPHSEAKIHESERLRAEELNQQNIEALVAESNLKMEIFPVTDLDNALHDFVNKDDRMAFFNIVRLNLEETRNRIAKDSDTMRCEEEDLILKVGESLEERLKERSLRSADTRGTSTTQSMTGTKSRTSAEVGIAASFSDEEDAEELPVTRSATRGARKAPPRGAVEPARGKISTRGRGKGRVANLKLTTLDSAMGFLQSGRLSASTRSKPAAKSIDDADDYVDSPSSEETERYAINDAEDSSEEDGGKGRKRDTPSGRGRGAAASSKRGKKSDTISSSSIHRMLLNNDDDDDDDDSPSKRSNKPQPRVTRNYGALRR